jgi:hypothetical protein
VETLATQNADGSVTVMVDDHAVASSTDNNGSGAARTVIVDISSLGNFSSASELSINASSSASSAPAPVTVTPAPRMTIQMGGYGVTWLQLKP